MRLYPYKNVIKYLISCVIMGVASNNATVMKRNSITDVAPSIIPHIAFSSNLHTMDVRNSSNINEIGKC